jgi:nitrous oxidase accessory protein
MVEGEMRVRASVNSSVWSSCCYMITRGSHSIVMLVATVAFASAQPGGVQQRVDGAQPGDTVVVEFGVYPGNVAITKPVVLKGIGRPVIRGDSTGSVVTVLSASCVIEGFVIERSGDDLMREDAGILVKSRRTTIVNNELRNVLFGIYLFEADSNHVGNNCITGRPKPDIGQRGSGIHIWNSHHNVFSTNVIREARDGFYIQYAHHTLIQQNEASGVRYGVHYMYADSNSFLLNHFHDNVAGAAIMYSRGIQMRHNVFSKNRGFSSFGILFQDCHFMVADSNVIVDNGVGMFFEATTDNLFRHNIIARNDVALQMFQNSTSNTFTENNFIDNLSPLSIVGKRTGTTWSVSGRGNFWSSYDGYDLDLDGIGDVPMKIQNVFQYLEGQNANLRLYLYSPASQALATAASAFPVIDVTSEADPHPMLQPIPLGTIPAVHLTEDTATHPSSPSRGFWVAVSGAGIVMCGVVYSVRRTRGRR